MQFPLVGQKVKIEGQEGKYIVISIDGKRYAADLMLSSGKHEVEENVPFFALEALMEDSQTARKEPIAI